MEDTHHSTPSDAPAREIGSIDADTSDAHREPEVRMRTGTSERPTADAPSVPTDAGAGRADGSVAKRVAASALAVAALLGIAVWGYDWWTTGRFVESTDNAYVQADIVTIAPQVAGGVTEVAVRDNQRIAAGDVLVRIDAVAYAAERDAALADLGAAEATLISLDERVALQRTEIDVAVADVTAAEASLGFARAEEERNASLRRSGTVSVQAEQDSRANLDRAAAALTRARAQVASERQQLKVVASERALDDAALRRARATLARREDDVEHAVIVAPRAGTVGNIGVRAGEYVGPGRALMSLVPADDVHVVANFKETQIGELERGMPVSVTFDAFDDVELQGTIDSLAPASGAEFSVLPADNATGNFTKIVQRLPVRIALSDVPADLAERLRPGLSAEVSVATKASGGR